MSFATLSYPLVEQRPSSAQKAKEAVKLARELGFGQKAGHVQTALKTIDGLRVTLCGNSKCWG